MGRTMGVRRIIAPREELVVEERSLLAASTNIAFFLNQKPYINVGIILVIAVPGYACFNRSRCCATDQGWHGEDFELYHEGNAFVSRIR